MAVAAVVVLGAVLTYTGHLPGPMQQLAHDTLAAPSPQKAGSTAPNVASSSARPLSPGTSGPAAASPSSSDAPSPPPDAARTTLCNAFWTDLTHQQPAPESWNTPRYQQLVTDSGGARQVFSYCFPVWDPQDAPQYPSLPAYPPYFPAHWDSGKHDGNDHRGSKAGDGGAPGAGNADSGTGNDSSAGASAASTPASSPSPSATPASPQASDSTGAQQRQQGNGN
jgi:hypothetical protein